MSKRRGISTEEKRIRILQLFHEKKDFFQLKELEKIAPKEKGIVPQSVKEIVQSLVDDGLVDTDKIGSSIYYWSYPDKALSFKKKKLEDLEEQYNQMTSKLATIKEELEKAKNDREDSAERQSILEEMNELKKEKSDLEEKLKAQAHLDPEHIETLKDDIKKMKNAVNLWTDNIFAVRSWCKKKFMIEGKELDKQFGIPEDFEYIE